MTITHLLFADDSMLFFRAEEGESRAMHRILMQYERDSGEAINFQKSGIFFSKNVTSSIKVWTDPWLRGTRDFKVETQIIPDLANLSVSELWIPGWKEWDIELVEEIFPESDAREIASTLIWHRHGQICLPHC